MQGRRVMAAKAARLLVRLRRAQAGVAMVEFALAAPLVLLAILGGLEIANYALAQFRVSQMAMTVADNAGRVPTTIDETDVFQTFAGANIIGKALDFENRGRIVLSSVEDNDQSGGSSGQYIRWQRCFGKLDVKPRYGFEGAGKTSSELADGIGAPYHRIKAVPNTAMMFVEVTYKYQPLFSGAYAYKMGDTIRYETAFNVRGRQNQAITNTTGRQPQICKQV